MQLEALEEPAYHVDPQAGPPGALYWIAGRLLFFAGVGLASAVGSYAIGDFDGFDLYWIFAVYCVFCAFTFLGLRGPSLDRVRSLYEFIVFVDGAIIALVCFVVPIAWGSLWFSGGQITNRPDLSAILLLVSVPIDFFFCRWTLRKLKSMEFLTWWSHACRVSRQGTVHRKLDWQFGIPAMLMWTAVLAGAFATYSAITRAARFRINGGISTAYCKDPELVVEMVELERIKPFVGKGESHLIIAIRDKRDDPVLRVAHSRASEEVWLGQQRFVPTPEARVTVFQQDRRWSISQECTKEEFIAFLANNSSTDLSSTRLLEFLERP